MTRDIDQIIELLRKEISGVQITQLQVAHPGVDDDGLWFISVPGRTGEVQIFSSSPTLAMTPIMDDRSMRWLGP